MKIFLSLFFLFWFSNAYSICSFREENVVSLSGTATVIFKELGLLQRLGGISIFNPISKNNNLVTTYPGGIFLSQNILGEFRNKIVFFDESRDLSKILNSQKIKAVEIQTRNLSPKEAIHRTLKEIIPLIKNCAQELAKIENKRVFLENKIMKALSKKRKMMFFLGEIKSEKFPEMILANDGVVKWLREENKIYTYPTDLAYVNWSSKILFENTDNQTLMIGVNDSGREMTVDLKIKANKINLFYPGSLVPGISQLEAFAYLFEKI
jgi:hypothetical protein